LLNHARESLFHDFVQALHGRIFCGAPLRFFSETIEINLANVRERGLLRVARSWLNRFIDNGV